MPDIHWKVLDACQFALAGAKFMISIGFRNG